MKSEVEKILTKNTKSENIQAIKILDNEYPLYIVPRLCDENLNIFEGFLLVETKDKSVISYLKSKYKPPVSGYAPRIGLIFYSGHLLIKDYRINRYIVKTLRKTNKNFISKLKKSLTQPTEENFNKLFDRSDVIDEFYILFRRSREYLLQNIKGIAEEKKKEEFVDNFMMQMLTLWYLQERGFFNNDLNYFITKFKELKQKKLFKGSIKSFYDFLLFFFEKISNNNGMQYYEDADVGKVVVVVPAVFINGEQTQTVRIPDKCFYKEGHTEILITTPPKKLMDDNVPLLNLFESRDWTEGNIDEFVLGSIYEKLITYMEKKALSAYYTPEEITSYISKSTIEPYLVERINERFNTRFETIHQVIENADKAIIFSLFEYLKEIKILDPAVGSGHFLESAINVLLRNYERIREQANKMGITSGLTIVASNEKGAIKEIDLLQITDEEKFRLLVKFFIILSKNIYGVDINPSAIKVARARLFLTLAKHFKADTGKNVFVRFPNVHFNLRVGNSLIGYVKPKNVEENSQLSLDLFIKEEQTDYITERINVVTELGQYLEKITEDLKLKGDIIKEIKDLNQILSKKNIDWHDLERALRVKDKLVNILIATLNSQYTVPLNNLLRDITDLFNQKLDERFAEEYGMKLEDVKRIKTFHWFFEFPETFLDKNGFDVIIENPPWDAVKPVEKEFFSSYDVRLTKYGVDKREAKRIISELLETPEIKKQWEIYKTKFRISSDFYKNSGVYTYQSDVVGGRTVGGDLNYYKLFLERSYQLLKEKAYLGTIVPSGIYTDAGTKGLRKLFFEKGKTKELYCFENRRKIFPIHLSFKFTIFINQKFGKTNKFNAAFMLHDVGILLKMPYKAITLDWEMVKKFSPDSWSLIEFKSLRDVEIVNKMYQHPILKENKWLGKVVFYSEFHMTNDNELFNKEQNGLRLFEGKMIEQYNPYFEDPIYWIEEETGKEKLYGAYSNKNNFDYKEYRLGFRAVASSTNRRSMIATILPKNVFCGNSIIVIKVYDEKDERLISEDKLLYLCGVFNSFVFDYLLRLKITTNLNMFFIYQMPIPIPNEEFFQSIIKNVVQLTEDWDEFKELREKYACQSRRLGIQERLGIIARINAMIAKLYGLSEDELQHTLNNFHHKDTTVERQLQDLKGQIIEAFKALGS